MLHTTNHPGVCARVHAWLAISAPIAFAIIVTGVTVGVSATTPAWRDLFSPPHFKDCPIGILTGIACTAADTCYVSGGSAATGVSSIFTSHDAAFQNITRAPVVGTSPLDLVRTGISTRALFVFVQCARTLRCCVWYSMVLFAVRDSQVQTKGSVRTQLDYRCIHLQTSFACGLHRRCLAQISWFAPRTPASSDTYCVWRHSQIALMHTDSQVIVSTPRTLPTRQVLTIAMENSTAGVVGGVGFLTGGTWYTTDG